MAEHTTIQITKEQAEQLAERKAYDDESYKSVIAKLLDGGGSNNSAIEHERLAEDRQEQLEEMFSAYCADTATKEDMGDLAELIREIEPAQGENVDADDIQTAVRSALRQELPDRVLQG